MSTTARVSQIWMEGRILTAVLIRGIVCGLVGLLWERPRRQPRDPTHQTMPQGSRWSGHRYKSSHVLLGQ